jgi:hypothetical protein
VEIVTIARDMRSLDKTRGRDYDYIRHNPPIISLNVSLGLGMGSDLFVVESTRAEVGSELTGAERDPGQGVSEWR